VVLTAASRCSLASLQRSLNESRGPRRVIDAIAEKGAPPRGIFHDRRAFHKRDR